MVIKTAIVEDEEIQAQTMENLLKRFSREKNVEMIIQKFSNGTQFLSLNVFDFDIVFMDIQMPNMNGLDVAKKLREKNKDIFIVFVTDLAQYAIKGYEVDAIDYLVKPVVYEHLFARLSQITKLLEYKNKEKKISLKTEEGLIALAPSSLKYVETMNHKLFFHTDKGIFHAFGSLNEMEKILPKEDFVRCNHCYIVNLKFVTFIDKNDVYLGEDKLQISRAKKKNFLDSFTEYLGRNN